MDYRSSFDFSDQNTVIYGHNMRDGSMFAGLLEFKTHEYFEEHPYFLIYLPDRLLYFDIVASIVVPDDSIVYSTGLLEETFFLRFIEKVEENRFLHSGSELSTEDHFVTLSTCDYVFENSRCVLVGRLVEAD